jgi:hypothetical protein
MKEEQDKESQLGTEYLELIGRPDLVGQEIPNYKGVKWENFLRMCGQEAITRFELIKKLPPDNSLRQTVIATINSHITSQLSNNE